jgi:hypothetical protein
MEGFVLRLGGLERWGPEARYRLFARRIVPTGKRMNSRFSNQTSEGGLPSQDQLRLLTFSDYATMRCRIALSGDRGNKRSATIHEPMAGHCQDCGKHYSEGSCNDLKEHHRTHAEPSATSSKQTYTAVIPNPKILAS